MCAALVSGGNCPESISWGSCDGYIHLYNQWYFGRTGDWPQVSNLQDMPLCPPSLHFVMMPNVMQTAAIEALLSEKCNQISLLNNGIFHNCT